MANIFCFGDSITFGYSDPEGGWPQRLSRDLEKIYIDEQGNRLHAVLNLGISGETSSGLLGRIENEIKARKFSQPEQVIIVAIGTNDSIYRQDGVNDVELDAFTSNIDAILKVAQKYSKKIMLLGLLPCDESKMQPMPWSSTGKCYSNSRLKMFNDQLAKICAKSDVHFEDMFADMLKFSDLSVYLFDGLHPNSAGHQYIADRIKKRVAEMANGYADRET